MKLEQGDEVYSAHMGTTGHEFYVATENYMLFQHLQHHIKLVEGHKEKRLRVACYQAYAEFVRSLYEYYVAIIKWNERKTFLSKDYNLDLAMNDAAQRLINFYQPTKGDDDDAQTELRTMNNDLTEELQARVLAAFETGTPLEIRGSGSKRFLGRTPTGEPLEVAGHAGIVNYQPKELVVTARCGTTLETIETTLVEQGQLLPFEPPHLGPDATLGGTIACGLSGPARPYAGSARDLVLGTRVLIGRGQVLRFGGEVMKNVAGYDLSRLMTGAYGTLGLLLDVSLKVMPIPAAHRTLVQEQPASEAIRLMNAWAGTPLPITATCCDGERLFVRLAGAEAAVDQAAETIGGETLEDQDEFWQTRIREQGHDFFAGEAALWRLSLPSATLHLNLPGRQLIEWGGAQRWYRGKLDVQAIREAAIAAGGHATLFRGGDRDGEVFQPPAPPLMAIHRNLKQAFDPKGLLNPGRLFAEF